MFIESVVNDLLETTKRLNNECAERINFESKLMEIIEKQDKVIKEKEAQIKQLEEKVEGQIELIKSKCLSNTGVITNNEITISKEN